VVPATVVTVAPLTEAVEAAAVVGTSAAKTVHDHAPAVSAMVQAMRSGGQAAQVVPAVAPVVDAVSMLTAVSVLAAASPIRMAVETAGHPGVEAARPMPPASLHAHAAVGVGAGVAPGVEVDDPGCPAVMEVHPGAGAEDVALPECGAHPEGGRAQRGEHRHGTEKSPTQPHHLEPRNPLVGAVLDTGRIGA
jgi:hypothetical protein